MKLLHFPFFFFLLIAKSVSAQTDAESAQKQMMDSIKNVYLTEAAIRNPLLRQVTISTDVISSSNIRSQLYGNDLFEGKLSQVRTKALLSIPLKSWGKNSLSASFSLFHQHFNLHDVKFIQPIANSFNERSVDKLTVGFTGSYTRVDSLFGRQIIYMGSLSGLTGRSSSIQKVSYLGGVILTLKQTPEKRVSVGLLLNLDPSIDIPVIPFYTYWRKYQNGMELNVNLPQEVSVRKSLSDRFWASFGTSISGSVAFFRYAEPGFPKDVNFSIVDLKTGPKIEYRFAEKLIFGLNAGLLTPIQARQFEVSEKANDYFLKNKINSTPFVNFSISVLPFL